MTTLSTEALAAVTGGASDRAALNGFKHGFDSASWCPPANTNAGWNCRLAAGRGGAMAASPSNRWIR